MKIKFYYEDNKKCNLNNPDEWLRNQGCCCICQNRIEIFNHPWLVPLRIRKHKKVFGESLKFYICKFFNFMDDKTRNADIVSKHGICEGFRNINDKEKS